MASTPAIKVKPALVAQEEARVTVYDHSGGRGGCYGDNSCGEGGYHGYRGSGYRGGDNFRGGGTGQNG